MNKIYFEVVDDVVIKQTPMPEIGPDIYTNEVVMTKEIFQECYKKWIKPQKEYEVEVLTRGNCMKCGKELDEGLFFCKECEAKAESEEV